MRSRPRRAADKSVSSSPPVILATCVQALMELTLSPASLAAHTLTLNAGDEAETQVLADLADLPEEVEIQDKLLIFSRPEEIKKLIHDQEQTVIRKLLVERRHHFLEGAFVL